MFMLSYNYLLLFTNKVDLQQSVRESESLSCDFEKSEIFGKHVIFLWPLTFN